MFLGFGLLVGLEKQFEGRFLNLFDILLTINRENNHQKLSLIKTASSYELAIAKSAKMTKKLKEMADFLLGLCHDKRLFCRFLSVIVQFCVFGSTSETFWQSLKKKSNFLKVYTHICRNIYWKHIILLSESKMNQ